MTNEMYRADFVERDNLLVMHANKFGDHGPNCYGWSGSLKSSHDLLSECIHPMAKALDKDFKIGLIVGNNFLVENIRMSTNGGMIVMDAVPAGDSFIEIRCWHPDDIDRIGKYFRPGDIINFSGMPDALYDKIVF